MRSAFFHHRVSLAYEDCDPGTQTSPANCRRRAEFVPGGGEDSLMRSPSRPLRYVRPRMLVLEVADYWLDGRLCASIRGGWSGDATDGPWPACPYRCTCWLMFVCPRYPLSHWMRRVSTPSASALDPRRYRAEGMPRRMACPQRLRMHQNWPPFRAGRPSSRTETTCHPNSYSLSALPLTDGIRTIWRVARHRLCGRAGDDPEWRTRSARSSSWPEAHLERVVVRAILGGGCRE